MIPFWLTPFIASAARQAFTKICNSIEDAHEEERITFRAKIFCANCGDEMNGPVKFCPHCGSKAFLTGAEIEHKQLLEKEAQKQSKEQERQRSEFVLRLKAIKKRCLDIARWKYCAQCNTAHFADVKFCPECGQATDEMAKEFVYHFASSEFPTLINNETSFDALLAGNFKAFEGS